jgi:hypothetical protein
MTGKQALLEKLRGQAPSPTTVSEHVEQQKSEWIGDVAALLDQLTGWLSDGEHEGLVKVERRAIEHIE